MILEEFIENVWNLAMLKESGTENGFYEADFEKAENCDVSGRWTEFL